MLRALDRICRSIAHTHAAQQLFPAMQLLVAVHALPPDLCTTAPLTSVPPVCVLMSVCPHNCWCRPWF